jgi:CRP/FNR family transcriptional regulator, cyclic AMP receptor protein
MNLATSLAYCMESPDSIEQNPISTLYARMEQRFGSTLARLNVKRNTIICTQGSKLSCLYLIRQGEVMLTRVSPDGRETLIAVLGPGEFFGESSLLSGTAITFSANATKRTELLQLPERKFKLLLEDPWACRMMLESTARRCDDAWSQMEVLGCTHVRDKVRSGLIWLSQKVGVETSEGVRIDLNQTQLARMVGCARETLSREVSELKRLHAVAVLPSNGRKALFVVNPEELSQSN